MARDIIGTSLCGWCITADHAGCRKTITHYDKTWTCPCTCSSDSESARKPKGKALKPPKA